jgi:uncharacterized protein YceH (UPF0502 family)
MSDSETGTVRSDSSEADPEELDGLPLEERAAALNQKIAELERRLDDLGEADSETPGNV